MQRRSFLRGATLLPLPLLVNQFRLSALTRPFLSEFTDPGDDRILVLIQLNGGNDGLNTVIPLDQYAGLRAVRENLVIPESKVLRVADRVGFHPSLTGLAELYEEGKVGVVQGVGYPQQNRSHFRSTDIWNTASASDELLTTGWLGRFLDDRFPGFPDEYPSAAEPAPFAIVLGNSVSETCQGPTGNFSIAINNIEAVGQLPSYAEGVDLNTPYGKELDWLRTTTEQSNQYAVTINRAVDVGTSAVEYPAENELAAKLKSVVRLISGGLRSRVYIVELGGFDTHANQVTAADTTQGEHATLLTTLSGAIQAFQRDLEALQLDKRVVGMTVSEFGRRIRSNGSAGSDHGDAAPLLVFGSCVKPGITGKNAEIDPEVGNGEAVPMQYDFRNVYGSLLEDWFGVDRPDVRRLLVDDFSYIPLLNPCKTTTTTESFGDERDIPFSVSPNPARDRTEIRLTTGRERVKLELFGSLGQKVATVLDRRLAAGEHRIPLETRHLPAGAYHLRLTLRGGLRRTLRLVRH